MAYKVDFPQAFGAPKVDGEDVVGGIDLAGRELADALYFHLSQYKVRAHATQIWINVRYVYWSSSVAILDY